LCDDDFFPRSNPAEKAGVAISQVPDGCRFHVATLREYITAVKPSLLRTFRRKVPAYQRAAVLLLFPRQIVRKAQGIRDAEGFLGACGGHDATVREDGRTSHIHLSSRPFCGPLGQRSLPVGAPIGHHPVKASE
jgi:hypothetical protein